MLTHLPLQTIPAPTVRMTSLKTISLFTEHVGAVHVNYGMGIILEYLESDDEELFNLIIGTDLKQVSV